ncbi:hypothetical protein D9M71_739510 [compost metagenome]
MLFHVAGEVVLSNQWTFTPFWKMYTVPFPSSLEVTLWSKGFDLAEDLTVTCQERTSPVTQLIQQRPIFTITNRQLEVPRADASTNA